MTSEGGGKLRPKKSRASAKPYERPKSLVGRLKDAVANILSPSWVTGLVSWPEQRAEDENEVEINSSESDTRSTVIKNKSTLNSQTQLSVTPPLPSSPVRSARLPRQPKIPLDRPSLIRSNHDRKPLSSPFSTPVEFPTIEMAVAGPSTSTPVLASSYSASLANAREYAAAARRRRGEGEEGDESAKDTNRVAARASTSFNSAASSSKLFSKLSDIGKLSQEVNSAEKRKSYNNSDHSMIPCDSHSECSEASMSTSGCSSMVPHPDKREYQREVLQLGKPRLSTAEHDVSLSTTAPQSEGRSAWGFGSELSERKTKSFLWPDSVNSRPPSKPQSTGNVSRPQFNPSLLGTSLWSERPSVGKANSSRADSPYLGKVTYGFGSASKRPRSCASSPYELDSTTTRSFVEAKVSRTSEDVMSSTAKRILLALEKMSTPLTDAKKIPTNNVLSPILETPLNFNATNRRRPNLSNKRTPYAEGAYSRKMGAPPTHRILTPGSISVRSIPSFAEKDSSSNDLQTRHITGISHNADTQSSIKLNSKTGGKIRARTEPLHYSTAVVEVFEEPNLPSVALPIQNLPVFDLIPSGPSLTAPSSTPNEKSKFTRSSLFSTTQTPPKTQPSTPSVPTFTFSTPVVKQPIGSANGNLQGTPPSLPNYTFHSPAAEESNSANKSKVEHVRGFVSSSSPSTSNQIKIRNCPEPEKIDHSNSALKVASELKTGSVMDILGKSSTSTITSKAKQPLVDSTSLGDLFRPPAGSWSCPVCMVNNKCEDLKCVACAEKKPTSSTSAPSAKTTVAATATTSTTASQPPPETFLWGDRFRPPADTWECPACMVRVSSNLDACVACQTKKPAKAASNVKISTMWECDICMVKNDNSATKCCACESLKRQSLPSSSSNFKFGFTMPTTSGPTSSGPTFKFSPAPVSTGFKFGFAADATVSSAASPVSSSLVTSKPVENRASFAFGISAVTSSKDAVSTVATSSLTTTASGFKFGLQSFCTTTTSSITAPVSSSTSTSAELTEVVKSSDSKVDSSTSLLDLVKTSVPSTAPFKFSTGSSVSSSIFTSPTSTVQVSKSESDGGSSTFISKPILTTSTVAAATSTTTVTTASSAGGFSFVLGSQTSAVTNPTTTSTFTLKAAKKKSDVENDNNTKPNLFGSSVSTPGSVGSSGSGGFGFTFGGSPASKPVSFLKDSELKPSSFGGLATTPKMSESGLASKPPVATTPVFGALSTVSEKSPASNTFTFGTSASQQPTAVSTNASLFGSTDSIKLSTAPIFGAPTTTATFGSSTSSVQSNFGAPANSGPPAKPSFVFELSSSKVNNNNNSGSNLNSTGGGGTSNAFNSTVTSAPLFGSAATGGSATFGGFGSQSTTTGTGNLQNQIPPSSGFSFGTPGAPSATIPHTPAAPFSFSANTAQQPLTGNNAVFNFTANQPQSQLQSANAFNIQPPNQMPNSGYSFNPAQAPNFDFGGGAGTSQNAAFEFNSNPFDVHQTAARMNRPIRKAKRRNK